MPVSSAASSRFRSGDDAFLQPPQTKWRRLQIIHQLSADLPRRAPSPLRIA